MKPLSDFNLKGAYNSYLVSKDYNDRIYEIYGKNVIIEGFEVAPGGASSVSISSGKAVIEGVLIEPSETTPVSTVLAVPANTTVAEGKVYFVCLEYTHIGVNEESSFDIKLLETEPVSLRNVIVLATVTKRYNSADVLLSDITPRDNRKLSLQTLGSKLSSFSEIVVDDATKMITIEMTDGDIVNYPSETIVDHKDSQIFQNAKAYTDQVVQQISASGIPKLVSYHYIFTASAGQTSFELPLDTFDKDTDTIVVVNNTGVMPSNAYTVTQVSSEAHGFVNLLEAMAAGDELYVIVLKNVPIGPDGAINAKSLAVNSMPQNRIMQDGGWIEALINSVTTSGMPKLASYEYLVTVASDNTTQVEVPSDIYNVVSDTLLVFRNGLPLVRDVNFTMYQEEGTRAILTMVVTEENVAFRKDDKILMVLFKNVPIGPEGSVVGNVIRVNSIPQDRIMEDGGWIDSKFFTKIDAEKKVDIDQCFYMDLESYYGNTKLVDDFQDSSSWTQVLGTQSMDLINIKMGRQSLKITENDNTAGLIMSRKTISLDLTSFNNGKPFSDGDYIVFPVFISDVSAIDLASGGVSLLFSQGGAAETTDAKYCNFAADLVTGWNYLKAKKSDFTTTGTGAWSGIQSVRVAYYTKANFINAYVSFQLIQLIKKDPLEDKPNPFQKFGQRELRHIFGEWFVGYEFGSLIAKEISGLNASVAGLRSITYYKDCHAEWSTSKNGNECIIGSLFGDGNNYISLKAENNLFLVTKRVNGVDVQQSFTISATDFVAGLRRKGNQIEVIINSKPLCITTFDYLEPCLFCIGVNNPEVSYIKSASVTETSHAHHADIAERLAYRNLMVPALAVGSLRKTKVLFVSTDFISTTKREVIIDLGDSADTGILDITVAAGYNMGIGGNAITKRFHMQEGTNFPSHYRYVGEPAASIFAITDIWVESGRKKVKIVKNDGHSHPAWITLESYGNLGSLENAKITRANSSVEPFVKPSMTPTETVITSGFAPGWSGFINARINQEGLVSVWIYFTKTSDITDETIYTLPTAFRPTIGQSFNKFINLMASNGAPVPESGANIMIQENGNIHINPIPGSTTIGTRKIYTEYFNYYL